MEADRSPADVGNETAACDAPYPANKLPYVAQELPEDERFVHVVENLLLGYGYNTARAYFGDLVDIYDWAKDNNFCFFSLTDDQIRRYQTLMRRRKYSENTIRRRTVAWRAMMRSMDEPVQVSEYTIKL